MRLALVLFVLAGSGSAWGQPSPEDVRARRFVTVAETQRADFERLLREYAGVFHVIGRARSCGLDWQKPHDDFVRQLQRRHGLDMHRGGRDITPGFVLHAVESGLSDGGQGPEAMFARGSSTCAEAAVQLPGLRLPALPQSLALRPGERSAPRPRPKLGPGDDLIVSPQSRFVRSYLQGPVPSDPRKLLVIREILWIAGDEEAAWALDRYLERTTLAAVLRERVVPPGTVDRIILDELRAPATADEGLRERILATLQPRLAQSDGSECARAPLGFGEQCKYEGRSVWSGHSPQPEAVYLRIMVENTSSATISRFEADLIVSPEAGSARLECRSPQRTEWRLAPGQRGESFCRRTLRQVSLDRVLAGMQAVETDASRWSLEVKDVSFVQPPVQVNRSGSQLLTGMETTEEIKAAIRSASCLERASCIDDWKHKYHHNPLWPAGTAGLLIGAGIGGVIGALFSRRWSAIIALILSILSALNPAGWLLWTFYGELGIGGFLLVQLATCWWLFFLAGLWGMRAAVSRFRSNRA